MTDSQFPAPSVLAKHGSAIAVLFSNVRSASDPEGYSATADRMEFLARQQPGFLGVESVRDSDGNGITISYWKDRASALAWKVVGEHAAAQQKGRDGWYEDYVVRIVEIVEEYGSRMDRLQRSSP